MIRACRYLMSTGVSTVLSSERLPFSKETSGMNLDHLGETDCYALAQKFKVMYHPDTRALFEFNVRLGMASAPYNIA